MKKNETKKKILAVLNSSPVPYHVRTAVLAAARAELQKFEAKYGKGAFKIEFFNTPEGLPAFKLISSRPMK